MNDLLIFIAVIVVYFVFRKITAPKVENINGSRLNELLKDKSLKGQFIDVRTPNEFTSTKVKGFKNIPLQSLSKRFSEINKDIPVILMCASGSRSMRAARVLNKAGYENLVNVKGGLVFYKR